MYDFILFLFDFFFRGLFLKDNSKNGQRLIKR